MHGICQWCRKLNATVWKNKLDQVMELSTKEIWPEADQFRLALVLSIGGQSHLGAYMNTF